MPEGSREVHLVADTNLFFECKALEELRWDELGYDPIVILLTKPVLDATLYRYLPAARSEVHG